VTFGQTGPDGQDWTTVNGPRPSIADALEHQDVVWLSSTRPDGRPHLVPLWFLWDGESILVFSKPDAQKVRNLQVDPRVMVAVGEPGLDFDVELIEAVAEVVPAPTCQELPDSFARKYGARVARGGITCDRYAAVYSQPIRIRPSRWLDWGGRGWIVRPDHPATREGVGTLASSANS
jgi:PPOX class probable F420-dependent enzyme